MNTQSTSAQTSTPQSSTADPHSAQTNCEESLAVPANSDVSSSLQISLTTPNYESKSMDTCREIFESDGQSFFSEDSMKRWLTEKGVNCIQADSAKGLHALFGKIQKGEARLVYSESEKQVYRCATTARISTEVTIHGELYPLFELCQIFLKDIIEEHDLEVSNPEEVVNILSSIKVRSAHVRNSLELWETFIGDEDPFLATRRGIQEELGLSWEDAEKVAIKMLGSGLEYEEPIDWPGIHSILQIYDAYAVLPEEISKPVFVELEKGDQLTIFVATPNSAVLRGVMKILIPKLSIQGSQNWDSSC